jgi:hypothetical protein
MLLLWLGVEMLAVYRTKPQGQALHGAVGIDTWVRVHL